MPLNTKLIIAAILVAANCAAFIAFWRDKKRARLGLRRIPEATLLGYAFWGGSIGALLGQQLLRHKTVKQPFRSQLAAIAILHILVVGILLVPSSRQWLLDLANNLL